MNRGITPPDIPSLLYNALKKLQTDYPETQILDGNEIGTQIFDIKKCLFSFSKFSLILIPGKTAL